MQSFGGYFLFVSFVNTEIGEFLNKNNTGIPFSPGLQSYLEIILCMLLCFCYAKKARWGLSLFFYLF